jgi:capsular exopolysaccharide synthesis family protein
MEPHRSEEINLLDYWSVLQRRRWVIYLAVVVCVVFALLASVLATPQYRATCKLQIERQNPDILTFRDVGAVDSSWTAYSDFYETQYQILASESVALIAARRLDLLNHPLYLERKSSPGWIDRLKALIPRSSSSTTLSEEEMAVGWVQAGLDVSPVRNSHLVLVSWVCADPELAAQVANAVASAYINFNIDAAYRTTDEAANFLVNQIASLKDDIARIEDRLQDYGESKRIVSIDDGSNITLTALTDVAKRRTEAQTELAQREAEFRAAKATPPEALEEVMNSALIARLKQEYALYDAEYSEQSKRFKEDWPDLKTLRSKLDQSRERIDIESAEIAEQVIASAEAAYKRALNEVRNLDALLTTQEGAAQAQKRDVQEYSNLLAESKTKRDSLDALLARQNEMALSTRLKDLDVTSTNLRIVDRARAPVAPFRPNFKLNLLLGLIAGLLLGVTMAFTLDHLDNTFRAPADVEKIAGVPTLAVIPKHGPAAAPVSRARRGPSPQPGGAVDLVSHREGRASASEAYRDLRTALLLSNPGQAPRRIVITSAVPEDGKSATAINLSVVLAQLGRKILLVDTDLRRPRLHKVFDADNKRGVSTFLSGLEEDPLRLVVATGVEGLNLLPSGPIPPNPSELLNSPFFDRMGKAFLEAGYDHVVFDSPPALSVADPIIIASVVDGTIVVVRANRTPRESLRLVADRFRQAGIRPIGVVVNDLDLEAHGYGRYRYYRGHGYYVEDAATEGEGPHRKSSGRARSR